MLCSPFYPQNAKKSSENGLLGAGLGRKHGNSRVIHAAFATWQFTKVFTRESDLGQGNRSSARKSGARARRGEQLRRVARRTLRDGAVAWLAGVEKKGEERRR